VPTTPNPQLYVLERPLSRSQVLDELAALPGRLAATVEGASGTALAELPGGGDWSALQTLLHVRDATLVYAFRFRMIVFNDDPFLPDYDENNWVASARDAVEDIPTILDAISASRADLINMLRRLDDASWERTGRHEAMGPVVLEHYARHQVVHEEMHIQQIARALASPR
jgi:hypothetical protein